MTKPGTCQELASAAHTGFAANCRNLVSNTTPIYFRVCPFGLQRRHIVCQLSALLVLLFGLFRNSYQLLRKTTEYVHDDILRANDNFSSIALVPGLAYEGIPAINYEIPDIRWKTAGWLPAWLTRPDRQHAPWNR